MLNYNNIVAATDFSKIGDNAVRQAGDLAKLLNVSLTILHVVEHFPEGITEDMIPPENLDPQHFLKQQSQAELEKLRRRLLLKDAIVEVLVSRYAAGREIASFARKKKMDLIVIGTHGDQGVLDRMGSTANAIMHDARSDVLLVRL